MKDNLDITISFGDKKVETNLKSMEILAKDLKAGRIKFQSTCHKAKHYFDDKGQKRCPVCHKICEIEITY